MLIRAEVPYQYRRNDRKVVRLACRETHDQTPKAWRNYRNPKTIASSCVVGTHNGQVVCMPAVNPRIRDDKGGRKPRVYQNAKSTGIKRKTIHKPQYREAPKKYTGDVCKVTYVV